MTINCEAKGYPEPVVTWLKFDSIDDYSNNERSLHIFGAKIENAGQYECIAQSSAEEKLSKIITVSVIGKQFAQIERLRQV